MDLTSLSNEQLDDLLATAMGGSAGQFDERGFLDFYRGLWKREPPPYSEDWVKPIIYGEWVILYCFRGSTKTTTLTITGGAFCLGHEPHTSLLIAGANDEAGSKMSATIADIIEHYDFWKKTFPNVVPDKEKGWGAQGYFIKDVEQEKELGYGGWLQKCQKDHLRDPSFIGLGVNSGQIPGMHPRRLMLDDIHDRKNSAFPKDRENVVDTVRANILPTITKAATEQSKPFIGVACTFWDKSDAYNMLLNTGLFKLKRTPIIEFCEDGDVEFEGRKAKLTWPEGFPLEQVKMYRDTESTAEFARMYLCDLTSTDLTLYHWLSFDAGNVDVSLPTFIGVDPLDTYKASPGKEGGRSWFALGKGIQMPNGSVVISDGILEQCSPSDMETYIVQEHRNTPNLVRGVMETIGGGSASYDFITRNNPGLRLLSYDQTWVYKMYRNAKASRQYEILEPLFRNGVLQVSTRRSPFLDALRSYLDKYPNLDEHAREWDVADSVVMVVAGIPTIQTQTRVADGSLIIGGHKALPRHPLSYLGSTHV